MTKWKPFETAPKDGSEVLYFDKMDGSIGIAKFWTPEIADDICCGDEDMFDDLVNTWDFYNWHGDSESYGDDDGPTHWMPLPKPPK